MDETKGRSMLSPKSKARELIVAVRNNGQDYFVEAVHSPELDIQPGEYWRVTVERIPLGQPYNEDAVLCDAGMEELVAV